MAAIETCDRVSEPAPSLYSYLQNHYPTEMREWVKYEAPDDESDSQILERLKRAFVGPYPSERTVHGWRDRAESERKQVRRRVWERIFADKCRYLVPKLVSILDEGIDEMHELLLESRGKRVIGIADDGTEIMSKPDPKIACLAMGKIRETASELLVHLGAPTLEPTVEVGALRQGMVADAMAQGHSKEQAEALVDSMVNHAARALGTGAGDESDAAPEGT